ncbi:zinc finger protein 236-like isoform X2 [Varroa jacobsoni]|uniref:zinc finger protein 236-like isoform X2 n=1 Tax=Varroa jacobsoni TaxID=62625 RepID=UPI000BF4EE7C|nr:zinc finger protein 236-like isoform X2 [Varroa jacobsoni]
MHVNCAICSKYHPAHLSRMHGVVEKSNFLPFSPQHWDLTTGFRSSSKPDVQPRAGSVPVDQMDTAQTLMPVKSGRNAWLSSEQAEIASYDGTLFNGVSELLPLSTTSMVPSTAATATEVLGPKRRGRPRSRLPQAVVEETFQSQDIQSQQTTQSSGWDVAHSPTNFSNAAQEESCSGSITASSATLVEAINQSVDRRTCFVCLKRFSDAFSVRMHVRVHTNEKPFACPHCPHRTAQKGNLKSHIKRHHGDVASLSEVP